MATDPADSRDYSYEQVLARQLGRWHAGDVAVGISTSGNAPNFLRGLETASEQA